jgi:ATP-binding cassette subfamily F protein 3
MSKNTKRRMAILERDIEQAEAALAAVEDDLADPDAWATPARSERSTDRHRAAKRAVEELYEELASLEGS